MSNDNSPIDTVGDLYDAVLEKSADALHSTLARIDAQIAADGCHWFALNSGGHEAFTVCTYKDVVSLDVNDFYAHYAPKDPRQVFALSHPDMVFRCSDYFDQRYVDRNEFYQDYLLPQGRRYTLGGSLGTQGGGSFLAFNRFKGNPDFSDAEVALVKQYVPHLRRVTQMLKHESIQTLVHSTQADLLQQQGVGVVGLDKQGHVLFINPSAREFLAHAPHLGWQGATVRSDSPLALACKQAQQTRQPQPIRVQTTLGHLVVTAWATPRQTTTTWLPSLSAASDHPLHTCVLVQLLRPGHRITPSLLMQLYGLTAAEARLTKELVQGTSVEDYAHKFSVSVATVRTQLRHVLAKTGYQRQQDLVRHLATIQVL